MRSYRPAGMSSGEDDSDDDFEFSVQRKKNNSYHNNFFNEPSFSSPEEELFDAIKNNDLQTVKEVVSKGVNLNALQAGWTPFMFSCFHRSPEIMKVLLKNGSNVNFHKDFFTPLMAVCTNPLKSSDQQIECVGILLDHGVDINATDRFRTSSLMFAAKEGHHGIVKLLVEKNCEINKTDKDGWNALFHAVNYNHLEVIDVLVAAGVNLKQKDLQGHTAYDLALSRGFDAAAAKTKFETACEEPQGLLFNVPSVLTLEQMLNELPSKNIGKNPGFPSEVYGMLQGMNLQMYAECMFNNRVQLGEFLIMNDDQLRAVGVRFFAHRQKLLSLLKRFHLCRWQKQSIGLKTRNETIELVDGIKLLANAVRQLYVMQSTILYMQLNKQETSATDELQRIIKSASKITNLIEDELINLQKFGKHIDRVKKVQTVDLIVNEEKIEKRIKLLKISMVCAFGAIAFWKNRYYMAGLIKTYINTMI